MNDILEYVDRLELRTHRVFFDAKLHTGPYYYPMYIEYTQYKNSFWAIKPINYVLNYLYEQAY
jgi:hypothetical protein